MTLAFAGLAPAQAAARARTAILVVQQGGPNFASDAKVRDRLTERGFTVQIEDQAADPEGAKGADLIVLSSTVSAKDVQPGWRQLKVPLVTWENDFLDDLAMTGKRHDVDFGEAEKERYLWIVNAPQPMAAGLPAGIANVYVKQAPMSWGKPGLGATIIATLYGQPEKVAIFGYETGATMDYETLAPARRVMLFLGNDGFSNLSASGLKLFDAAIDWAVATK
ncbi:hypothetical protein K8P63_10395 [Sphingomonas nostoxanthinifaciens]|nr:hypothetical protein K8P63_10395 [Sphingomonas nostoxanthinifaciens]